MENFNINGFMEEIEKELNEEALTIEQKQNKLNEINQLLQKMNIYLNRLFKQRIQLEEDLRKYEEEKEKDNEDYMDFINFYEMKFNNDEQKK